MLSDGAWLLVLGEEESNLDLCRVDFLEGPEIKEQQEEPRSYCPDKLRRGGSRVHRCSPDRLNTEIIWILDYIFG